MDWNWFFSAVAQSTAAIVGLIGAFVFTKIVNSQAAYDEDELRIGRLLQEADSLSQESFQIDFRRYNLAVRHYEMADLRSQLPGDQPDYDEPEEYYEKYDFSRFDHAPDVLYEIEDEISNTRHSTVPAEGTKVPGLEETATRQEIHELRRRIDDLVRRTTDHFERVQAFLERAEEQPHSSRLVSWTVATMTTLFAAGVVYPLGLLPVSSDELALSLSAIPTTLFSLRGGILGVISLVFGLVAWRFLKVNGQELVFTDEQLEDLREISGLEYYSPHFGIWKENAERFDSIDGVVPFRDW